MARKLCSLAALFPLASFPVKGSESTGYQEAEGEAEYLPRSLEKCLDISGQYEIVGRAVPETSKYMSSLPYILDLPAPNVAYDPDVEKKVTLEMTSSQRLEATITLGSASRSIFFKCHLRKWVASV